MARKQCFSAMEADADEPQEDQNKERNAHQPQEDVQDAVFHEKLLE